MGDCFLLNHAENLLLARGKNHFGQLGLGHTNEQNTFVPVPGITEAKSVLAITTNLSGTSTLLLTTKGLFAAGSNIQGQLGLGKKKKMSTEFECISEFKPSQVRAVACGELHSAVISDQGLFVCGWNSTGGLGLGHHNTVWKFERVPKFGSNCDRVLQVACGTGYTLVLTTAGLFATGHNDRGQLGLGHCKDQWRFVQVPGIESRDVTDVVCGAHHSVLVTRHGVMSCGTNGLGQLGLGSTARKSHFELVQKGSDQADLSRVQKAFCGSHHTLLLADDALYSCGSNNTGQLCQESGDVKTFAQVHDLDRKQIISVACSPISTLILTQTGLRAYGTVSWLSQKKGTKLVQDFPQENMKKARLSPFNLLQEIDNAKIMYLLLLLRALDPSSVWFQDNLPLELFKMITQDFAQLGTYITAPSANSSRAFPPKYRPLVKRRSLWNSLHDLL